MKADSWMENAMGMGNIAMRMETGMRGSLPTTNIMEPGFCSAHLVINTKVDSKMAVLMVMGNLRQRAKMNLRENSGMAGL